jgi:hypothetical protein
MQTTLGAALSSLLSTSGGNLPTSTLSMSAAKAADKSWKLPPATAACGLGQGEEVSPKFNRRGSAFRSLLTGRRHPDVVASLQGGQYLVRRPQFDRAIWHRRRDADMTSWSRLSGRRQVDHNIAGRRYYDSAPHKRPQTCVDLRAYRKPFPCRKPAQTRYKAPCRVDLFVNRLGWLQLPFKFGDFGQLLAVLVRQHRQSLRAEASVLAFPDRLGLAIVAIFHPGGLPFCAGNPSTECSLSIIWRCFTKRDLAKESLNFVFKRLIPMEFAVFALALLGSAAHQIKIVIVTALSDQPHTGAADALGNAAKQISQSCALASTYSLAITHRCLSIGPSEDERCRGLPAATRRSPHQTL